MNKTVYGAKKTEARENGFPELLAHKVAEIAARDVPATSFTVIYIDSGEPIVHAEGCMHILRDSLNGAYTTEDFTGTLTDVAAGVYADQIDEDPDGDAEAYRAYLNVKPCAR